MTERPDSPDAPSPLPSHKIPVTHFEMTLVWPLFLEDGREPADHESSPDYLRGVSQAIIDQSANVWSEWNTPFPNPEDNTQYAEWVYHHAFLRNAFYQSRADIEHHRQNGGQDNAPNRNVRVLRRTDMEFIETAFDLYDPVAGRDNTVRLRLKIDDNRVLLYVFDTGVVLLVLTARYDYDGQSFQPFTLQTVLKLQDVLRRCYAPYWATRRRTADESPEPKKAEFHFAGHCPLELRLISGKDERFESHFGNYYVNDQDAPNAARNQAEREAVISHRTFVSKHREPYTVEFWRKLMEPITPRTVGGPKAGALQFEQIVDERVPILSYIAVPDPRRISPADWRRLAVVDEDGSSDQYSYSPSFTTDAHLATFVYDRFWHPTSEAPSQGWFNTRWLCCGYGFTGIGSSKSDFFIDAKGGARAHFNHHYYVLGLIAHFHHSSLLSFKRQLSDAVEALRSEQNQERAEEKFEKELIRIEKDLLAFRNVYWFYEPSNQIQGQELHELFARHLRTRELFKEVSQECREANAIVAGWNNKRQTETSFKLTIVAAAFLMVNAFVSTLDNTFDWKPRAAAAVAIAFAGLTLFYLNNKTLLHVTRWLDAPRLRWPKLRLSVISPLVRLFVTGLVVFAGYKAFIHYVWPAFKPNSDQNPQKVQVVPETPE